MACAEAALKRGLGPRGNTRPNAIGERGELSVNQVLDVDTIPFVADEQVLIGRKRLDAVGEALDEIFGISGGRLVSNRVHDAEHVLGAMIDFAHKEVHLLLALLAFGNVPNGADNARGRALAPGAFEICEPLHLHPTNFAISVRTRNFIALGFGWTALHPVWKAVQTSSASSACASLIISWGATTLGDRDARYGRSTILPLVCRCSSAR
jgi:hypothetical protein